MGWTNGYIANNFYPFGMIMPGRNFNQTSYRYGYNKGSEKDDEISGAGNHFTTFYREGDTRLLTWWSVDPEADEQPWQSPYSYMDGNPIKNNDPDGDCPTCFLGALVGAAVEYGSQVASNVYDRGFTSEAFTDVDLADIGIAAVEGFVTSGASAIRSAGTKIAVKVATEVIAEVGKNALDAKYNSKTGVVDKSVNDAKTVAINTVIGLTAAKTTEALIPKSLTKGKGPLTEPTKKAGVKEARVEGKKTGEYLTTQGRQAIEQKNIKTKAVTKGVNAEIKKAPVKVATGAATNKAKVE